MRVYTELYIVLGLDPNQEDITQDDIKKAYRKKAAECHPDKLGPEDGGEAMTAVNAAYQVLKDPELRAAYDKSGAGAPPPKQVDIKGFHMLREAISMVIVQQQEMSLAQLLGGPQKTPGYKDFTHSDLKAEVTAILVKGKGNVVKFRKEHQAHAESLKKTLSQFEFKGEANEPDVLRGMFMELIASHETSIAKAGAELEECEAAIALLNKYGFNFTPRAQQPAPRGSTGRIDGIVGKRAEFVVFDDFPEDIMPKPKSFGQQNDEFNRKGSRK